MPPTTVLVDFTAAPGRRDFLVEFLGRAIQKTVERRECLRARLIVAQDSDVDFAMIQDWVSADAHKAYAEELMADEKFTPVREALAAPPRSTYYDHVTRGGGDWGGPGHLELCSDDVDATRSFLTDVFGWRFEAWMEDYVGFHAPGDGFGGLRPRMKDTEPAPQSVPYLVVDDLDARLEAVKAAGGTITVPIQTVPNAGRFFWFTAPGGLTLAAWESAS